MSKRLLLSGVVLSAVLGLESAASAAITTNGVSLNGVSLNGWSLNGWSLNGWSLNGWSLNGRNLNGPVASPASTGVVVKNVEVVGGRLVR